MKLSYALATLGALPSTDAAAFQGCSPCVAANSRPSSALGMRRRSPMARSFLAPSDAFRQMDRQISQMDEFFERRFDDFFDAPMLGRPTTPFLSPALRADLVLPDLATVRRPYRYRISEDDDKFQLSVDLPGVKASDMKVQLEQEGRVLRISGKREVKKGDMSYESKFDKAFVLDRSVDVDKIDANLSEGVMTIDAPKKPKEEPEAIEIPIREEVPKIPESPEAPADEIISENSKTDEVEMKVEAKTNDEGDEDVVDLDKVEEKPKEEDKAEVHGDEDKKDDLKEDGEILI